MLQFAIALIFKHFICDFVLQSSEMAVSKGIYGSKQGLRHSFHHMAGTFFVSIMFVSPKLSLMLAVTDFMIHYHIDWFKMKFGPQSYKDKHYWVWFGADQFLHQLTVTLLLILVLVSGETVDFKF
jgi:hypothetical protein